MRRVGHLVTVAALMLGVAACSRDTDSSPTTPTVPTPTTAVATTVTPTSPTTTSAPVTEPPTTATPTTATPTTVAPTTAVPTTTEPVALVDVKVYLLRDEQLVIDHREVAGPEVLRGAIESLLDEPAGTGLSSAIPAGTELRSVNLVDGLATIDLTGEFESGGGTLSMLARVGQIVFTATQFDNVDRVMIWLDGASVDSIGGEGLAMDEPWTRAMVPWDLTGGVIVDIPAFGATVRSPFTVTGEADVYEAEFPIEIRRDGVVLTTVTGIRAGAWGEWDEFEAEIAVDAPPGPIQLVAYDAGGCGDDPECPPIIETVVDLVLGG